MKVLSQGSSNLRAVGRHFDYIGRQGDLAFESDDGYALTGRVGEELIDDWGLHIDALRPQANLTALPARKPIKLVHKLVVSMPVGTPPQKVLSAVRNFAREEFQSQHRYAMVLHTDEPHPHVHLVLRATSEDGRRLTIKKATLRLWRAQFAHHLRELGVPANATERAVRGEDRKSTKDGIYRARLRGDSSHVRAKAEGVARELAASGSVRPKPGRQILLATRVAVQHGWQSVADKLLLHGHRQLAADAARFASGMDRPLTEREWIARALPAHVGAQQQEAIAL